MTFACMRSGACKCGELYMFKAGSAAGVRLLPITADASAIRFREITSLSAACELTFDMRTAHRRRCASAVPQIALGGRIAEVANPPSLTGATAGTASARDLPRWRLPRTQAIDTDALRRGIHL